MSHLDRRRERLLKYIQLDDLLENIEVPPENRVVIKSGMKGVEIGALTTPIVIHNNVKFVDRVSTDELKLQYAADKNVPPHKIVNVDYATNGNPLRDVIPEPLDFILASHVIEHTPNILGWLMEMRQALKTGGVLCLAIPDKRYTFDYCRELSTIDQIIEAYILNYKKASPRMVYDYYANVVLLNGRTAIGDTEATPRDIRRIYTTKIAMENVIKSANSDEFFDTHNWVFTQSHFLKLISEIYECVSFPFNVKECYEADGCEFITILEAT